MAYYPMEKILKRNNNAYKIVLLASKRALELSDKSNTVMVQDGSRKITTKALDDVEQGRIYFKEDQKKEKPKAKKGKAKGA